MDRFNNFGFCVILYDPPSLEEYLNTESEMEKFQYGKLGTMSGREGAMPLIIFFVSIFLVACENRLFKCKGVGDPMYSTSYDKRCQAIQKEARKKGHETGVCYKPKNSDEVFYGDEILRLHPDPVACKVIKDEA